MSIGDALTMRLGASAMTLALLLGAAPAVAQQSPGIIPAPTLSAEKTALVHVARRALRKRLALKIDAPATVTAKPVALHSEPTKSEPSPAQASEIPPAERLKIQSALLWAGDYTGSVGGGRKAAEIGTKSWKDGRDFPEPLSPTAANADSA